MFRFLRAPAISITTRQGRVALTAVTTVASSSAATFAAASTAAAVAKRGLDKKSKATPQDAKISKWTDDAIGTIEGYDQYGPNAHDAPHITHHRRNLRNAAAKAAVVAEDAKKFAAAQARYHHRPKSNSSVSGSVKSRHHKKAGTEWVSGSEELTHYLQDEPETHRTTLALLRSRRRPRRANSRAAAIRALGDTKKGRRALQRLSVLHRRRAAGKAAAANRAHSKAKNAQSVKKAKPMEEAARGSISKAKTATAAAKRQKKRTAEVPEHYKLRLHHAHPYIHRFQSSQALGEDCEASREGQGPDPVPDKKTPRVGDVVMGRRLWLAQPFLKHGALGSTAGV